MRLCHLLASGAATRLNPPFFLELIFVAFSPRPKTAEPPNLRGGGQCRTRLHGDTPVKELLHQIQDLNGGTLAGIPDVIALGGGRVFLRDVKKAGKDRVTATQHRFAHAAKRLLGTRLDLAIVEFRCT